MEPSSTLSALLRAAADRLGNRLEAEVLIADALGVDRAWLFAHGDEGVDPDGQRAIRERIDRRAAGEPVAHILGMREFWSRDFTVTPDVLIPRPETETLVEHALALDLPDNAHVVDLGTGSGCIAVTLAAEHPGWAVAATDISDAALEIARVNAARHGAHIEFLHGAWYQPFANRRFNLIVSNPPYIAPGDRHLERGDLRFEPAGALAAGDQGRADLECIISGAPGHLHPCGWLLVEHGYDQSEAVTGMMRAAGLDRVRNLDDVAGVPRVAVGQFRSA